MTYRRPTKSELSDLHVDAKGLNLLGELRVAFLVNRFGFICFATTMEA